MAKKSHTKDVLIQVTSDSRGGIKLPREVVREYFSENARQSFAAEGVKYTKTQWDSVEKRKRHK